METLLFIMLVPLVAIATGVLYAALVFGRWLLVRGAANAEAWGGKGRLHPNLHFAALLLVMTATTSGFLCSSLFWWPMAGGMVASVLLVAGAAMLLVRTPYAFATLAIATLITVVVQGNRRADYACGAREAQAWLAKRVKEREECCRRQPGWCEAVPLTCADPFGELRRDSAIAKAPWLRGLSLVVMGGSVVGSLLGAFTLARQRRSSSIGDPLIR